MAGRENKRSRIRAVEVDNRRSMLGITRMDSAQFANSKGEDEEIDESVLRL